MKWHIMGHALSIKVSMHLYVYIKCPEVYCQSITHRLPSMWFNDSCSSILLPTLNLMHRHHQILLTCLHSNYKTHSQKYYLLHTQDIVRTRGSIKLLDTQNSKIGRPHCSCCLLV